MAISRLIPGATTFTNIAFAVPVTTIATTATPVAAVAPVAPFGAFTGTGFPFGGIPFISGTGIPFFTGFGGLPATIFTATNLAIPVTAAFVSPFATGLGS